MVIMDSVMTLWASHVSFETCCNYFEKIYLQRNMRKKIELAQNLFRHVRRVHQLKSLEATTDKVLEFSMFPLIRLILPHLDHERRAYGIKESVFAKLYINMLQLGPNSTDALKLKNYKVPSKNQEDAGDFAAVLFTVSQNRCYTTSTMMINELNLELDSIACLSNHRELENLLLGLFKQMDTIQQKWLVRIILKNLHLGMGPTTWLNLLHPDAKDLFDVQANLFNVCKTLCDTKRRLSEIQVQLFEPCKPMLADRCNIDEVEQQMGNKPFYVEIKYDGERLQIHKNESSFKYFSRNGFDFTDDFGSSAGEKKFCTWMAEALDSSVVSCIIDGEICAFNHITQCMTQKSQKVNIRSIPVDDPCFQQCVYLYDIIYLNGTILTNRCLRERSLILRKSIRDTEGRVYVIQRKSGRTKLDVINYLNEAIDRRDEGIILKNPDSIYKPNARNKGGWLKIKPEYNNELIDQCDLVIIGGYYGSGRLGGNASGIITHFLLAVAQGGDSLDEEGNPNEFIAFCRVGSGYNIKELWNMLKKLEPNFNPTSTGKSSCIIRLGREKPDLWIEPKHSLLVQVKASEIVASNNYLTGCTLRFPRVERIRTDKSWAECMTFSELEKIRSHSCGKLATKHATTNMTTSFGPSKAKKTKTCPFSQRRRLPIVVASQFQGYDAVSGVKIDSTDLGSKIIVVEPGNSKLKSKLERIIISLGGIVEQNPTTDRTFCYIETGLKLRAKNVIKSQKFDVVKSDWLLECESEGFRWFRPSDMIYTTAKTYQEIFEGKFDIFGDSFTERATINTLRYSMLKVSELEKEVQISHQNIMEFEFKHSFSDYIYGLFRSVTIYFDVENTGSYTDIDPLDLPRLKISFYGARISSCITSPDITHVMTIDSPGLLRMAALRELRRNRNPKFHLVTSEWLDACIESCMILEERYYEPAQ